MTSLFTVGFAYAKHFFSSHYHITDQAFKLHHEVTMPVLLTLAIATAVSEITVSMSCYADAGDLSEDLLNTYCWMQNTFMMPDALSGQVGVDVAYPGVDTHVPGETRQKFQRYYHWIPYILLVQSFLFYLPYFMWKSVENGQMQKLLIQQEKFMVAASENVQPMVDDKQNYENHDDVNPHRLLMLTDYIAAGWNRMFGNVLPAIYFLCSVLALVNVVLQLCFVDSFTNHEFSRLNWGLLGAVHDNINKRNDSLLTVFPRVAKCRYHQYGAAGSVVAIDAMCVMPFNLFFERVFVYCWFWFLLLAVLSIAHVTFCFLNIVVPPVRLFTLKRYSEMIEPADKAEENRKPVEKILESLLSSKGSNLGDWFMMLLIAWNIHPFRFGVLVKLLENEVVRNGRRKNK